MRDPKDPTIRPVVHLRLVAVALMLGGGMASLQALMISIGLPFGLVLLIMCVGLLQGLRSET